MATLADSHDAERRFYGRMAIAIIIAIFIGFAPSFYLFQTVRYPRPNPALTPLVIAHGLALTGWLAIFYTQTRLVAAKRRDIHRQLGVWGMALAAAILPITYLVSMHATARNTHPPFSDAANWSAVPLLALPPMLLMLIMGWRSRMDPQAHKRFMLLFTLMTVEPGVGRWPIFPPVMAGHIASSIMAFAFIIPLVLWDKKSIGRLHRATKIGLFALAFGYLARHIVWALGIWPDVVAVLPY
ncbi:hypothetical protein [Sphingorhabdus sp.]|uniref:hypothetical protein n=1 Tax=Sphingorhabdus sp. TaxID=1902408 RepID=UPI0032B7DA76